MAGRRVEVREHLDGRIVLHFRGRVLEHGQVAARPVPEKQRPVFANRKVYKPSANHPYNRAARSAVVQGPSAAPPGPAPQRKM